VTWWPVIALCAGAYGLKAVGLAVGGRLDPDLAERWHLEILVVPVLAALIAVQSFSTAHRLVLDARAAALLVAALLIWRRAPFVVVALAAAVTAAGLRLII
jgi:Branched-chain amino acid transport protein (AzlD)